MPNPKETNITQHTNNDMKDYFVYDEATQTLTGEKTKIRYTLGDEVLVKVIAASREARTIDFEIIKKL